MPEVLIKDLWDRMVDQLSSLSQLSVAQGINEMKSIIENTSSTFQMELLQGKRRISVYITQQKKKK